MNLYRNAVIRIKRGQQKPSLERVIFVDPKNDALYVFDMHNAHQFPQKRVLSAYNEPLESGTEFELIDYTYIRSDLRTEELTAAEISHRDRSWDIIEPIVTNEPAVFDKKERARMIKEAVKKHGVCRNHVVRRMMLYWRYGMSINALAAANLMKGGRGKLRQYTGKKRGRPVKSNDIRNIGKNITKADEKNFEDAIKKHYLTRTCLTLKATYIRMIRDKYADVVALNEAPSRSRDNTGFLSGLLPSYSSFLYWSKKMIDVNVATTKRKGYLEKAQNHSAVIGNQTDMARGPGDIYQIDSTVADLAIVDETTEKNPIGRPILYMVVDVFTRCVAGFWVGLEGPSWEGAKMALYNCTQNKVDFCARLGTPINQKDWPVQGLPRTVISDRGEMASCFPDLLKETLGVGLSLCAPGFASWKGIVESKFRLVHNTVINWIDEGKIQKFRKPKVEEDLSKLARHTLKEFKEMILAAVLEYNSSPMPYYPISNMMREYSISPIPTELWTSGIELVGGFHSLPQKDLLVTSLMYNKTVTINKHGLVLNKRRYTNAEDLENDYYSIARENPVKVKVSYDPCNMKQVYVLTDSKIKTYTVNFEDDLTLSEYEILAQIEGDNEALRASQEIAIRNRVMTETKIEEIKKRAAKEDLRNGNPPKKDKKNVRKNRAIENERSKKETRMPKPFEPSPTSNIQGEPDLSEFSLPEYDNDINFG